MKAMKLVVAVAALVIISGMPPETWAQCPNPRIFRSSGKFGNNVQFETTGSLNAGHPIGRIWDTANAETSNNGLTGPEFGSLCPPSLWWRSEGDLWFIDGALTGNGCVQFGCPDRDLTLVIEDYDAAGPPGVSGTAYYMGLAVTETPPSARWFDYGMVDGVTGPTTIAMREFPRVRLTASYHNGNNIDVSVHYADQGDSVHTWLDGGVAPTDSVVAEWHLMKFTGTADPGRLRSHWTTVRRIDYQAGGTVQFFSVPCSSTVDDEWLAVGIGFNGGAAGVIDSALVGQAIVLECDPYLADPGEAKPDFKPADSELQTHPRYSGGRR